MDNQEENYRILVIDDIVSIHQDFLKILKPVEHQSKQRLDALNEKLFHQASEKRILPPFKIDFAIQGQDGLELVRKSLQEKKPYAVAFVDVQMPPGEDGVETIERIWKIDPHIQIVICTAYAKYSWEDLMNRFGETDHLFILKKPFDNMEVIQMALSLSKKWNLEKGLQLRKAGGGESGKKMDSLAETLKALEEINSKLKANK